MKRECSNPKALPDWSGMFSQVVITEKNGLKFVHIFGQVGVDNTKLAGDGSLRAQTQQALTNLKIALESVGVGVSDVVKRLLMWWIISMKRLLSSEKN